MKTILIAIALSAFVGPGFGQMYNKEYKKGLFLIGITLVISILLITAIIKASFMFMPAEMTELNIEVFTGIKEQLFKKHPTPFLLYNIIILIAWGYGVIDAYKGAKRRIKHDASKQ